MSDIIDLFPQPTPDDPFNQNGKFAMSNMPTAQEAIECLVIADGNVALAAEIANRKFGLPNDDKLTPAKFQMLCGDDLTELQRVMRAHATLKIYGAFGLAIERATAELPNLRGADSVRVAVQLGNLVQAFTDSKKLDVDVNVREEAWTRVPAPVKEIIAALEAAEAAENAL